MLDYTAPSFANICYPFFQYLSIKNHSSYVHYTWAYLYFLHSDTDDGKRESDQKTIKLKTYPKPIGVYRRLGRVNRDWICMGLTVGGLGGLGEV